jgi:sugar lactone lactonase YvrE
VVTTFAGSGTPAGGDAIGQAAAFFGPTQLCLVGATLFVADSGNNAIRAVALDSGAVTTYAGTSAIGGTTDGTGPSARFLGPWGIAADAAGNLYVSDRESYLLRKVTPARVVTTVAGAYYLQGSTDGAGSAARFESPRAIARDAAGNLYVTDANAIRKVTPDGTVSTFAGTVGVPGNADGTGPAARFTIPSGIVVDATGIVYVADSSNHNIRKIWPDGVVTTLCGGIIGTDDGTASAGQFHSPAHMALDPAGNIVIADTYNHAIRRVTPAGVVTTIAGQKGAGGYANGMGTTARFFTPEAVAVDATGNIYVADSGNNAIRMIDTVGVVTTFAGSYPGAGGTAGASGSADGTGSAARFNDPQGLTLDAAGNLYVADNRNALIRKVTPAAVVTTLLGQLGREGVQLGAAPGSFTRPSGLTVSGDGRQLWVVDETAVLSVTLA